MPIDFDSLRGVQRKEKNTVSITEIPESFYMDLAKYIAGLLNGEKSLDRIRLLENTVRVARDISQRRIQKIVARAIKTVKTGEYSDKYLTPEEKRLYDDLLEVLRTYSGFVDKILTGEYPEVESKSSGLEEQVKVEDVQETREMLINESEQNLVLARVVKPIPRFVAPDGNEYGPYERDDVIKIPSDIADILADQGLLELL